jgi:hypothetical protein
VPKIAEKVNCHFMLTKIGLTKMAVVLCLAFPVVFGANIAFAGDADKLDIDLIAATINKTNIFKLTLDQVTDLVGRPTMVEDPGEYKNPKGETIKYGAGLYYFDKGLSFHFNHPESDPLQHCQRGVYIYLSRTWDQKRRKFFQPFQGTLSKGLDGSWKVKRVMADFNEFSPKDRYDATEVQKRKADLEHDIEKLKEAAKQAGQDPTAEINQILESENFWQAFLLRFG